jgi:plasmid replication initiation protein
MCSVDRLPELRVSKDNRLVEAGYRLSLNEQRLVLCAIAQVDSRRPMHGAITITASEFASAFDVAVTHAYSIIKQAAEDLFERDIRYIEKRKSATRLRWIYKRTYNDGDGSVTIAFSPEIEPYLTLLSQKFTSYSLKHISHFNSVYAIRIYEMLKQFERIGERTISLEFLRDRLELDGKYERFGNVKARVLDPAVQEINRHSDIKISYEIERRGRQPVGVVFNVIENPQRALGL